MDKKSFEKWKEYNNIKSDGVFASLLGILVLSSGTILNYTPLAVTGVIVAFTGWLLYGASVIKYIKGDW